MYKTLFITLISLQCFISSGLAEETSTPPIIQEEESKKVIPEKLDGYSSERVVTMIERSGITNVTKNKIIISGKRARFETGETEINKPDISLYDFDQLKEYRVIHRDKIFFEYPIKKSFLFRMQREGMLPLGEDKNISIQKIPLGKTIIEDHPCNIILLMRNSKPDPKKKKLKTIPEYTLVWEATDLDNMPIRVDYVLFDFTRFVIEYKNLQKTTFDPSQFEPPAEYINLSPY